MVEAPGVVLRPQQQLAEHAQRRPPDWVAYTDGSEDLGKAGWAYAVLIGGDAIGDEGASLTSEGYGPVVTSAAHPAYLGARKHTNNTAELTALAELLRALLSSSPQRAGSSGVVRTDTPLRPSRRRPLRRLLAFQRRAPRVLCSSATASSAAPAGISSEFTASYLRLRSSLSCLIVRPCSQTR